MQRIDVEARWLADADLGVTFSGALIADGLDRYAVDRKDPKGNECDIN